MANVVGLANEWSSWAQSQAQMYLKVNGHGVKPTLPPRSFFRFPPSDLPTTVQPPIETINYEPLFLIPSDWYNAALSPAVPITFALVYATVITFLNSVNKRRGLKPWAISKTYAFKLFVISHNIFLTVYSLWTFIGMVNALRISVVNPREYGLAATVDSLCKMHGPRGHGSAATFNERSGTWGFTDRTYHLMKDTMGPDSTDVGRIWNEGLSFYGWLFYISKFYEVVDTLIIIAKGKKSSFLQTYHHAGAMLCMWAGIRYMSPPIWMFVTVNSFIHTVMYAFYTATTVGVRVPKPLKQTLTTLQITQFVIGASYAFAHYFVAYQIPVSAPYIYHLGEALRDATPSIKSDASSALSVATATASADVASWLKKLALRAAGREGLAENVENQLGQTFGIDAVHAVQDFVSRQETRYRDELQWVHCLDTSGETFAIYLNIFYLAPLTWLFLQFFFKSYIKRTDQRRRSSMTQLAYIASQSINDARKGVGRDISEVFENYQGANGNLGGGVDVVDAEEIRRDFRDLAQKAREEGQDISEAIVETSQSVHPSKVTEQAQQGLGRVEDEAEAGVQKAKEVAADVTSTTEEAVERGKSKTSDIAKSAKKSVENLSTEEISGEIADTATKFRDRAEELAADMRAELTANHPQAEKVVDEVQEQAGSAVQKAREGVTEVVENVQNTFDPPLHQTQDNISKAVGDVKEKAEPVIHETEEKAKEVAENVQDGTETAVAKVSEKKQEETTAAEEKTPEVKEEPEAKAETTGLSKESSEPGAKDVTRKHNTTAAGAETSAESETGEGGTSDPAGEKSFADVAAKGIAEEDKDEAGVIALDSDDGEDKKAPKEGDAEGVSDTDTDSEPQSISGRITDAMSSDISQSPYSLRNKSQSSILVSDLDLGANASIGGSTGTKTDTPTDSHTSASSTPKKPWHSKRRGRSFRGDSSGDGDVDIRMGLRR